MIEILQADYRETLARCNGAADLVFTSPPYADARTYGAAVSWTDADYAALGDAVFGALRPGGHAVIVIDSPVRDRRGIGSERGLHPFRLAIDWADRVGFRFVERLVFARATMPGAYPDRFRNDFELMLWFQRPGPARSLNKGHLKVATMHRGQAGQKLTEVGANGKSRKRSGPNSERCLRDPGTIWNYGAVGNRGGAPELEATDHPARFPYRLAADAVRCWSSPDDLVCDPFLGSGTTALACYDHRRRFIGGDLFSSADGKPWADVAREIIEARARQGRLDFGNATATI